MHRSAPDRRRKVRRVRHFILAIAVLSVLMLAALGKLYRERQHQIDEAAQWSKQTGGEYADHFGEARDVIRYQGKRWRRNTYMKAILFMGIDRKDTLSEPIVFGRGGQSDGIFLAAYDSARNTVRLVAIPRDTMTSIMLTDLSCSVLGKEVQQLTLAYAYGDGREISCHYMCSAVTELLNGLSIDHYVAIGIGALAPLNDAVGGVEVRMEDPQLEQLDPEFHLGETVLLEGSQAERFLRYRNTEEGQSAIRRMERQKSYISAFAAAARRTAAREEGLAEKLMEAAAPYLVTDLSRDEYLKLFLAFLNSSQTVKDEDIELLPGEGVDGALYDEYLPDVERIQELILSLFYRIEE